MLASTAIEIMCSSVKAAGEVILNLRQENISVAIKANNDIITVADLRANEILKTTLTKRFPHIAWLSEECSDDLSRLSHDYVFVVDPIDGTREYANNIAEYAISLALVERGQVVASVIFNPATNEFFHAIKGQGAWLNRKRIFCCELSKSPLLLASRSEYKRGEWQAFEKYYAVKPIGSIAYKLGLVAAGKADATFSLGPKNEWDIAAGVLLIEEANGIVKDKKGQSILFNNPSTKVNGIIASTKAFNESLNEVIAEIDANIKGNENGIFTYTGC